MMRHGTDIWKLKAERKHKSRKLKIRKHKISKLPENYAGFVWNALSSIAAAASSVLLLMVVRRAAGIDAGAEFSIAVAVANVLINIGTLNNTGLQVSDVTEQFHFPAYRTLRQAAVFAMMAAAVVNGIVRSYEASQGRAVLAYCFYRSVYAYADVYQGRYQQKGRMDLAGKLQFFKILVPDVLLAVCVAVNKRIAEAAILAAFVQILLLHAYNRKYFGPFKDDGRLDRVECRELFCQSVPLFISAFASAYILNASKYSIDRLIDHQAQVFYTVMLLPATTVHMLAGFVYRPMLTEYAVLWNQKQLRDFVKKVHKIFAWMLAAAAGLELVSGFVLLPFLEWMYDISGLAGYRAEFGILLLAGACNAANIFLSLILTIMRMQSKMLSAYSVTFAVSLILPDALVSMYGISGAAVTFFLLMLLQAVLTYGIFCRGILHRQEETC